MFAAYWPGSNSKSYYHDFYSMLLHRLDSNSTLGRPLLFLAYSPVSCRRISSVLNVCHDHTKISERRPPKKHTEHVRACYFDVGHHNSSLRCAAFQGSKLIEGNNLYMFSYYPFLAPSSGNFLPQYEGAFYTTAINTCVLINLSCLIEIRTFLFWMFS